MMKIVFVCLFVCLFVACNKEDAPLEEDKFSEIVFELQPIDEDVSNRGSAYTETNKILSVNGHIFLVYLNSKNEIVIAHSSETSSEFVKKIIGNCFDNHGNPCLCIDDNGYLYVAFGGHSEEICIVKSKFPYDINEWEMKTISRSPYVLTYPVLQCYEDECYMLLRMHEYNKGAKLALFKGKWEEEWSCIELFKGNYDDWSAEGFEFYTSQSRGYNRFYANMKINPTGIHVALQNYEYLPKFYQNIDAGGGKSYFITYLFSEDFGETWKDCSGQKLSVYPSTPSRTGVLVGHTFPVDADPYYSMGNLAGCGIDLHLCYREEQINSGLSSVFVMRKRGQLWEREFIMNACIASDVAYNRDTKGYEFFVLPVIDKADFENNKNSLWGNSLTTLKVFVRYNGNMIYENSLKISGDAPVWLPNISQDTSEDCLFMFINGNGENNNSLYLGRLKIS